MESLNEFAMSKLNYLCKKGREKFKAENVAFNSDAKLWFEKFADKLYMQMRLILHFKAAYP